MIPSAILFPTASMKSAIAARSEQKRTEQAQKKAAATSQRAAGFQEGVRRSAVRPSHAPSL